MIVLIICWRSLVGIKTSMLVLPNSFLKKSSFIVKMVPIRPSFFMGCSCGKKCTQDESPE